MRGCEWLHPGVYALPGSAPTHERRVMAALLAAGERSLVARRTALWLMGVADRAPTAVELVVPWDRRRPKLAGVTAFGSTTLLRSDVILLRGLRVTSAARTVCDLAAVAGIGDLRAAIVDARQRHPGDRPAGRGPARAPGSGDRRGQAAATAVGA